MRIRLSSKPYKHTLRRKILSMSPSHRISTGFPHRDRRARLNPKLVIPGSITARNLHWGAQTRNRMVLRLVLNKLRRIRRMPRRKTRNWEKILRLEVPCFEGTLREREVLESMSRGRDD